MVYEITFRDDLGLPKTQRSVFMNLLPFSVEEIWNIFETYSDILESVVPRPHMNSNDTVTYINLPEFEDLAADYRRLLPKKNLKIS